ncbi:MAG: FlgD immunoglobulin-like domain containing protein [Bacteroidota bacterium]
MKGLIVACLIAFSAEALAQTGPTVEIRLVELKWDLYSWNGEEYDNNEWWINIQVDVFDSTGRLAPFDTTSVIWWVQQDPSSAYVGQGNQGRQLTRDGEKEKESPNHLGVCEMCPFEAFNYYATVVYNGDTLVSEVVQVPDAGMGGLRQHNRISVAQKDSAGNPAGYFRFEYKTPDLEGDFDANSVLREFPADYLDVTGEVPFYVYSNLINVGAQQGFLDGTYQKHNNWALDETLISDVLNHKNFTLSNDNAIVANFKGAYNATLQSEFNGSPIGGNYVSLKDPWFIDDESHHLGSRNRGMNAEFKPVQYASNNVGVGSQWKGVFLNQSGPGASWQGTYYSVKARSHLFFWPVCSTWSEDEEHPHPSHQGMTYVFGNWSGTNVQFQYSTSLETPVVFTASGAVVKAIYSLGPPAIPEDFDITTHQHGSTYFPKLTWTANNEYNLAGYKLERKIDDGSWSNIATLSESTTQYIDMAVVTSTSYEAVVYYRLRAYNDESLYSDYTPQQYIGYSELILFGRNNLDIAAILDEGLPTSFLLGQNYPNPFNPETEISFGMPEPASVKVTILDALGREIAVLRDGTFPAGYQRFTWNGRDQNGRQLSSGIYFCRITATGESGTQFTKVLKMALTK